MMRRVRLLLILLFLNFYCYTLCQDTIAKGRVLFETLEPLICAIVKNKSTNETVVTNDKGDFVIKAHANDTLIFNFVGVTEEHRKFEGTFLKIILMDKSVNCLGAIWTKRQYKKAYRSIDKYYKKQYKKSEELNLWD